jgi:hypothetical protein
VAHASTHDGVGTRSGRPSGLDARRLEEIPGRRDGLLGVQDGEARGLCGLPSLLAGEVCYAPRRPGPFGNGLTSDESRCPTTCCDGERGQSRKRSRQ